MSQSVSDEDQLPPGDIPAGEPRHTKFTIVKPDPQCTRCEGVAEFDEVNILSHSREFVVELLKHPTLYDWMDTGDGPLCRSDYEKTYTGTYWAEHQRGEDRAMEDMT